MEGWMAVQLKRGILAAMATALLAGGSSSAFDYVAGIDVRGAAEAASSATGTVFVDVSEDGVW
jgi:phosphopantothenate synthetase